MHPYDLMLFILFRAAEDAERYLNTLRTFSFCADKKKKYQKRKIRRLELPLPCQPKGLLNGCKLDGAVERCERSYFPASSTTVFYVIPSSGMLTQRSLP